MMPWPETFVHLKTTRWSIVITIAAMLAKCIHENGLSAVKESINELVKVGCYDIAKKSVISEIQSVQSIGLHENLWRLSSSLFFNVALWGGQMWHLEMMHFNFTAMLRSYKVRRIFSEPQLQTGTTVRIKPVTFFSRRSSLSKRL